MKKILLLLICLLLVVGCKKNQDTIVEESPNVSVGEEEFALDTEGSINNLYFKHDLAFYNESEPNKLSFIYGLVDDPDFKIVIEVHPDENIESVINSFEQNSNIQTKKINDINWQYFTTENKTIYVSNFNNNTYTIEFTSTNNINNLIESFINKVYYKTE